MKVNSKLVQRAASRISLPTVLSLALIILLVFLSRSCVQLPEVVSAVTGREDNESSPEVANPAAESATEQEEPVLKPWQHAKPLDTLDLGQPDNTDDVVKQVENEKERADVEREVVEPDEVVKMEEQEEDREEDASAEDERHEVKDDVPKPAIKEEEDPENCLQHLFYDKPIKTGSTAVTYALREYIQSRGGLHRRCSYDACSLRADAVCNGESKPEHLIGHIKGKDGLVECMKERGYYALTSVRDPLERWKSAFLFNKMMKGTHYNIPWQENFTTFMERYPDCTLYHYYDRMSAMCKRGKLPWRERLKKIVGRYDEVIDLYDDEKNGGRLFQKIRKYIKQENVSRKPKNDSYVEEFNRARLEPEQALYDALKAKRDESPATSRVPC